MEALILLALIFAAMPFVLPIISLVRQSGLRNRLAALEDAFEEQTHTIDDLKRRLAQSQRDAGVAAPPIVAPPVPPLAAQEPVAPPPPPMPRPAVTPPPITTPTAAAPPPPRAPEKPL